MLHTHESADPPHKGGARLRLSSMAGTSAGMWGRSSSGPAAAASLHVVSSARPCTSATWEGRPAKRKQGEGAKSEQG